MCVMYVLYVCMAYEWQAIAKALAEAALFRSMDRCTRTPFQRSCRKKGILYSGGKVDDITVVACWIVCDD